MSAACCLCSLAWGLGYVAAAAFAFYILCVLYVRLILRPGRVVTRRFVDGKHHACISGDAAVDVVFDQVFGQQIYFRNKMAVPAPNLPVNKNRTPIVVDVGGNVGFFSEQV